MTSHIEDISVDAKLMDLFNDVLKIDKKISYENLEYQKISQWDSLNHINLMIGIEVKFGFKVPKSKVLELTNFQKIKEFIYFNSNIDKNNISNNILEKNKSSLCRGLNNIFYDETKISFIDGEQGRLLYRGYQISEMVEKYSFDEVIYLLLYEKIPTINELKQLKLELENQKYLSKEVLELIKITCHRFNLSSVLKSCVSILTEEMDSLSDEKQVICLLAKVPLIIANYQSFKSTQQEYKPAASASHCDYLAEILFHNSPITTEQKKLFEQIMILQAEHESNASAFAARVAVSTGSSLGNGILAAISTFIGPLHGGAITSVMDMLDEITSDNVSFYIQNKIKNKQPVYGFGHRVYRTQDPRSFYLKKIVEQLCHEKKDSNTLLILEKIKVEMSEFIQFGIDINVDYYSSVCFKLFNIPKDLFVPLFISNRIIGWGAHIIEQKKENILIRPRLKYTGHFPENK